MYSHESLSIFVHVTPNLLSDCKIFRDPASYRQILAVTGTSYNFSQAQIVARTLDPDELHYCLVLLRSPVTKYICSRCSKSTKCCRPRRTCSRATSFASLAEAASNTNCLLKEKPSHQKCEGFSFASASPLGFEPRSLVLETRILPLNYGPVCAP